MFKPVVCSPLTPSGMVSKPTNVATKRYTDAFKRQLKRLSRRYNELLGIIRGMDLTESDH